MSFAVKSLVVALVYVTVPAGLTCAQSYPSKPIHVVVPFPPGAADVYIRTIQPVVERDLGRPLVIENKPGANGYIGAQAIAKSPADGYNLLFSVSGSVILGPLTTPDAGFDTQKDFQPIISLIQTPMVLVVRSSLGMHSLDELISYAKKNPNKLNYGSTGPGSLPHIYGEALSRLSGAAMTHVSYKGFVPMVQALLGDEVDILFITTGSIRSQISSGKVRALAIDPEGVRLGTLPQVPDITRELPGFETIAVFGGLWAPAGTSNAIIEKLNASARIALEVPEVRKFLSEEGSTIVLGGTPQDMEALVGRTIAATSSLVSAAKAAGVKFE